MKVNGDGKGREESLDRERAHAHEKFEKQSKYLVR